MRPRHPNKESSSVNSKNAEEVTQENTVRGSGFTYDEAKERTDGSEPIKNAEGEEIVDLPHLGEPDRP